MGFWDNFEDNVKGLWDEYGDDVINAGRKAMPQAALGYDIATDKLNPIDAVVDYIPKKLGALETEYNNNPGERTKAGYVNFNDEDTFRDNLHSYVNDSAKSKLFGEKPPNVGDYVSIQEVETPKSTNENVKGFFSHSGTRETELPGYVTMQKSLPPGYKSLFYNHEIDHANSKLGSALINQAEGFNLPEDRSKYLGQETEISARLAELRAINDIFTVDEYGDDTEEARSRASSLYEELSPFIDGYKEKYPNDSRISIYEDFYNKYPQYAGVPSDALPDEIPERVNSLFKAN